MNSDPGDRVSRPSRDIWRLPEILALEIRWRRFKKPRRVTIRGKDHEVDEGLEVVLQLSEPFEVRALGPVLWIGDVPLTNVDGDGKTEYRFLATDPASLRSGDEIALSWSAHGAPRQRSDYRFEPPNETAPGLSRSSR
jgi:hypothetical protein